jgi:hypothetical protein
VEDKLRAYKLRHYGFLPEQAGALNSTLSRLELELRGTQDTMARVQQDKLILHTAIQVSQAVAGPRSSPGKLGTVAIQNDDQDDPARERELELPQEVDALAARMHLADQELEQAKADRLRILKSMADYQARVEQIPLRELDLAPLNRDYEVANANYRSLLDKKVSAGMATDMERKRQGDRFTMVDAPRVPEKPKGPRRFLLASTGCFLSFALAVSLTIFQDMRRNAILGDWELGTEVSLLGKVPAMKIDSSTIGNNFDSQMESLTGA